MNKLIIASIILIAFTIVSTQDTDSFAKYQDYINKFGKKFTSLEELTQKYQAYRGNMQNAQRLNSEEQKDEGEDEAFGETEFSDMDPEEFQQKYLNFVVPENVGPAPVEVKAEETTEVTSEETTAEPAAPGRNLQDNLRNLQTIPASFDWRTKGVVGVVKNQGSCGSCWSFASVANIEGLYARKYGSLRNFSEQQLIDCSSANFGCSGGFMEKAFAYVQSAGGLQQTSDYGSYRAYKKTCSFNRNKAVAKVKSWTFPGSNEATIRNFLYNTGPIAAAVNANYLQNYRTGVLNVSYCSKTVNHAITLVGYGTANGMDYWIVKNSWGASWGEKGYFRIRRGVGMCGINTYVVSAVLA